MAHEYSTDHIAGDITPDDALAIDGLYQPAPEPHAPLPDTLAAHPQVTPPVRDDLLLTETHTISAGTVPAAVPLVITLLPRDPRRRCAQVRVSAGELLTSGVWISGDASRGQTMRGGYLLQAGQDVDLGSYGGPLFATVSAETVDVRISVVAVTS